MEEQEKEKPESAVRLGRRIRALREKRELSQAQLAERAGLSSKYLGEIERGEGNISMELLTKVAEGLGAPLSAIVENEHEQTHEELIGAIIRLAPELSHKDAQIAYRMIKMLTE